MTRPILATTLLCLLCLLAATAATAKPQTYALNPPGSLITIATDAGRSRYYGTFPIASATITLDLKSLAKSQIAFSLNATQAQSDVPFAAEQMMGPGLLDAANYPKVSFRSTSLARGDKVIEVQGQITLRGVTQPILLHAHLFRPKSAKPGDDHQLTLQMTGTLSRHAFGATGWENYLEDQVTLYVHAQITETP